MNTYNQPERALDALTQLGEIVRTGAVEIRAEYIDSFGFAVTIVGPDNQAHCSVEPCTSLESALVLAVEMMREAEGEGD